MEQWGDITISDSNNARITFLKTFKDTQYFLNIVAIVNRNMDQYDSYTFVKTKYSNYAIATSGSGVVKRIAWYSCGY